jgi:signal transduction histidine kinase
VVTGLRARLFLDAAAVLLVAVALEMVLVWRAVGGYFVRQPDRQVSAALVRADALAGEAALDPAARGRAFGALSALVARVGGGLAFLPLRGGEGAFALGHPRPTAALLPAGVRAAAAQGATWSGVVGGGRLAVQAVPAVWGGRVQGVLVWARPVAGRDLARTLLLGVAAAGLAALAVGSLLWAWESQRLARPLARLADMARRIAQGDLEARVAVRSPREYADLAQALSSMAAGLETAEVARREFLASVAHELRTPLTALRGFLEALGDGTVPPDRAELYRTKCLDEVARLNRLLEDLLDMAKSEAGRLDLAIRTISLGELTSRAILLWESAIRQKAIVMRAQMPPSPVYVEADGDRVVQIVSNLLANAVQHTPPGGTITVAVTGDGRTATLAVSDTGPGIPPQELGRVWDRYYRFVPGARSHGSGLGLAIVRALAEAHGGGVAAHSGGGETRFEVRLPVRSPLVAAAGSEGEGGRPELAAT